MTHPTAGYGLAVTSLIVGIVSIPLVGFCGIGILTASLGFVLAVRARRVAGRAPDGARGLATAGIVVNGVVLGLTLASALSFLGVIGIASVGTLKQKPVARPSLEATASPAHGIRTLPSPRATDPTASPIPLLATTVGLGESMRVGTLTLAVLAYSEMDKCPGGTGHPAQAAKFVVVQARARNDGPEVTDLPTIQWTLDKYEAGLGAGHSCQYDQHAFGNACWKSYGRLFPGAECEGWLLFEVPERLVGSATTIRARVKPAGQEAETMMWRMQQ